MDINEEIKRLIFKNASYSIFITGYAVYIGAIYLFGFWRVIGFDVFNYLDIGDLMKAPIYSNYLILLFPLFSPYHYYPMITWRKIN